MVSTRPPTSKSSYPFSNPLVTVPNAPITIGKIVTCMFQCFSIPQQGRGTYPSFHILSVLFCGQPGQQSRLFCKFSFFVDYYKVWSSGRDLVIHVYAEVPQEFMCVIFQDRCWVMHIPFAIIIIYSFSSFSNQRLLMVSHQSLRDNKSPQVSRISLNILVDLNNAVVWIISTRSLVSVSSTFCINPLVTVSKMLLFLIA